MALGKAQLSRQNEFMVECVQSIIWTKIELFFWKEMVREETVPNYLHCCCCNLQDLCFKIICVSWSAVVSWVTSLNLSHRRLKCTVVYINFSFL